MLNLFLKIMSKIRYDNKSMVYSIYSDAITKLCIRHVFSLVCFLLHYLRENGKLEALEFRDDKVTVYIDF